MGWWVAGLGPIKLSLHDSAFGYMRNSSKTPDYFKNYRVEIEYEDSRRPHFKEILRYKLTDFVNIVYEKNRYRIQYKKVGIYQILCKKLFKILDRDSILISGKLYILAAGNSFKKYYLVSVPGDVPLQLSSSSNVEKWDIDSYEMFKFMQNNNLILEYGQG